MPIYQYNCPSCQQKVDVFFRSVSAAQSGTAKCPNCGNATGLTRVMSSFARTRSLYQRLEDVDHVREASEMLGNDPRSFVEWAKRNGREWDEELGSNWQELAERTEAGEDPAEAVDADYTFRYQVEQKKYDLERQMGKIGDDEVFDDPYKEYFDRPASDAASD